ncbi:cytochrome C oxidase subunit IV family protein [Shewanella abyssi]|uniref:cytochrome C oxidase subunit IV family protein n=1 Tax=Shewanella abyssi TaxID=311789 RepID=UPI00200F2A6F|nr:cytochrome C oxidase subunit IV family protein [Shewanella abyssi]MCL1050158.1 cytochrome C oxidase subunit IV family protein [Shewanella abyssi]
MLNHHAVILRVYLYLILLTIASAYMGSIDDIWSSEWQGLALTGILALTVIKGWQIVDVYMELKQAPALWRNLLRGYIVLLPLIIGFIYLVF